MKKLMRLNARVASVMLATILAFAPTLTALADSNNVSQDTISENNVDIVGNNSDVEPAVIVTDEQSNSDTDTQAIQNEKSSIPGNEMSIMTMSSESAQTNNVLSWDFIADTFNNTSNDAHADLDLDTGTLTIRGTGSSGVSLGNYARNGDSALQAYINSLPFTQYKNSIKKIIIQDKITGANNKIFSDYTNLQEFVVNSSTSGISLSNTFKNCPNLTSVEINVGNKAVSFSSSFTQCSNLNKISINAKNVSFNFSSTPAPSNLEYLILNEDASVSISDSGLYNTKWAINTANENEYTYLGSTLIKTNPNLTSVEIPDNITKLAPKSLINNNMTELTLKKGYTLYADSIQSSSLKKLTIENAGSLNSSTNYFSSLSSLEEVIYTGSAPIIMNLTKSSITKIYWLGGISSSMAADKINSIATIYCLEGSPVQAWCENKGMHYVLLDEEEVEEIKNGLPPKVQATAKFPNRDSA